MPVAEQTYKTRVTEAVTMVNVRSTLEIHERKVVKMGESMR